MGPQQQSKKSKQVISWIIVEFMQEEESLQLEIIQIINLR